MYGYVRPCRPQLRVCEYELYGAAYCGLCHTLKKRYGPAVRMLVNYDMTFLYMLLSDDSAAYLQKKRCIASPFRKKACCCSSEAMEAAADCTVLLAYRKLFDNRRDGNLPIKAASATALQVLKKAYKEACSRLPAVEQVIRENTDRLAQYEAEGERSLDLTADCFGKLTASLSVLAQGGEKQRILQTVLYHIGRYVYIADALEDLSDDMKHGRYNPVAARWALQSDKLEGVAREELEFSLVHTMAVAAKSAVLLSDNIYTGITENILKLGLPERIRAITNGQKDGKRERHPPRIG